MKYNSSVYRSFVLITQLGLSMLVPIFLCTFIGVFLEDRFRIPVTLPLIILGILAGIRNTYAIVRNAINSQKDRVRDIPSGLSSSVSERKEDRDVGDK